MGWVWEYYGIMALSRVCRRVAPPLPPPQMNDCLLVLSLVWQITWRSMAKKDVCALLVVVRGVEKHRWMGSHC